MYGIISNYFNGPIRIFLSRNTTRSSKFTNVFNKNHLQLLYEYFIMLLTIRILMQRIKPPMSSASLIWLLIALLFVFIPILLARPLAERFFAQNSHSQICRKTTKLDSWSKEMQRSIVFEEHVRW